METASVALWTSHVTAWLVGDYALLSTITGICVQSRRRVSVCLPGRRWLLLLYVDDILLSGRNTAKIEETKRQLMERFEVVDLGPATFLLGLAIKRDDSTGTIQLSQETYARGILDTYGMEEANPAKTPAEVKQISIKEKDVLTLSLIHI